MQDQLGPYVNGAKLYESIRGKGYALAKEVVIETIDLQVLAKHVREARARRRHCARKAHQGSAHTLTEHDGEGAPARSGAQTIRASG
jgi:hypothetical protein